MNENVQQFCIFGLFGAALALFFWKHAGPRESAPAPITPDDVPAQIGLAYQPAEMIVGMSVLPCPVEELAGPAVYTSNVPTVRPMMPAARNVAK